MLTYFPDPMTIFVWMLVVAMGLACGSFTNVLIHRLPRGESIGRPRSRCPKCANTLRWYHNIPVFSWIVLRGRCGFCGVRISWIYPVVELLCAGMFVAFFARYGATITTLGFWYLSVTLVATFFIDWEHRIIPNRLTYPGVIVGIAFAFFSPHLIWWEALLGAAVGLFGFLGVAYLGDWLFKKESLGGGDIKLAALLGAFLGAGQLALVLILAAAIGLIVSVAAMAISKAISKDRVIPFGPFLSTAAVLASFYGETWINYYINHFIR